MTLGYPGAFDSVEELLDGVHAPTGEDWTELADGMTAVSAVCGKINGIGLNYANAADAFREIRRCASGIVTGVADTFQQNGAGVTITFPAGVFSNAARIGVVAFRSELIGGPVLNDADTGPMAFAARSITTTSAVLYGWPKNGAATMGTGIVRVSWFAFESKEGPLAGQTIFAANNPQVYPPVISGFDAIKSDLLNSICFDLETLTRAVGQNPVGAAGASGSWTTVAAFLGVFDAMLSGSVIAQGADFIVTGLGVTVSVDGSRFPDATQVEVICMAQTDGADAGAAPGQNYPVVFAARDIQGGGSTPLTFNIVGWDRTGQTSGLSLVTNNVTVGYVVRRTMGTPV